MSKILELCTPVASKTPEKFSVPELCTPWKLRSYYLARMSNFRPGVILCLCTRSVQREAIEPATSVHNSGTGQVHRVATRHAGSEGVSLHFELWLCVKGGVRTWVLTVRLKHNCRSTKYPPPNRARRAATAGRRGTLRAKPRCVCCLRACRKAAKRNCTGRIYGGGAMRIRECTSKRLHLTASARLHRSSQQAARRRAEGSPVRGFRIRGRF